MSQTDIIWSANNNYLNRYTAKGVALVFNVSTKTDIGYIIKQFYENWYNTKDN